MTENIEQISAMPCRSFDQFVSKAKNHHTSKRTWVFRGQRKEADFNNKQWLLSTSLERECVRFGVKEDKRAEIESQMIREFQRRLHLYQSHVPDNDLTDEWLALMQHYGAPTRLLDFTYSPYVAAYFAFEHADPDSNVAIWAVDATWFKEQFIKKYRSIADRYSKYEKDRKGKDFDAIFRSPLRRRLIVEVNPFYRNERIAYQKGAFLCPGDVTSSFMDNLAIYKSEKGFKDSIIQYTIPTEKKENQEIKHYYNLN